MTGELKVAMQERAEVLEPFTPDLGAITGEGRRRVRRRRLAAVGAGTAVVLAVGFGVPRLVDGDDRSGSGKDAQVAVTESAPSTWAQGSAIHLGDTTIDVGHKIHAFVATTRGFVSTDPTGKVWSTVDGDTVQVGEGTAGYGRQLVADGERAGWIEFIDGKAARFVFLDQSTGSTVDNVDGTVPGMGPFDSGKKLTAELFALDGDAAYLRDTRGLVRFDVEDGSSTVLAGPDAAITIADAEQDQILHTSQAEGEFGVTVSSPSVDDQAPRLAVDGGDLSPTARFVMSEDSAKNSDDFTLVEVGTGTDFTPSAKADYGFINGYAWIDDSSYMALGLDMDAKAASGELLRCEVTVRTCEVTVRDLKWNDFQLPVGEHIGD